MEVKGAAVLYTLATLTITFAGFSALLVAIRQSAGATLSPLDRFLARTVVGHYVWLAASCLFPPILSLYELPESAVWTVSGLLFGLPMLALMLSFPQRRIKATGKAAPAVILVVFVGVSSLALAGMIATVFVAPQFQAAAYITALTVNFLTHGFAFVVALEVILRQGSEY